MVLGNGSALHKLKIFIPLPTRRVHMVPDTLSRLNSVLGFRDCLGPRVASYEFPQIGTTSMERGEREATRPRGLLAT